MRQRGGRKRRRRDLLWTRLRIQRPLSSRQFWASRTIGIDRNAAESRRPGLRHDEHVGVPVRTAQAGSRNRTGRRRRRGRDLGSGFRRGTHCTCNLSRLGNPRLDTNEPDQCRDHCGRTRLRPLASRPGPRIVRCRSAKDHVRNQHAHRSLHPRSPVRRLLGPMLDQRIVGWTKRQSWSMCPSMQTALRNHQRRRNTRPG